MWRDFAAQRLAVQALDVPPDQLVERAVGEDFDKRRLVLAAHFLAQLPVRRDGRRDGDDAVSRQQARDEPDPADVGVAIFAREGQPLAEVLPDFVAVQDFHAMAARAQLVADGGRKRRLAGAGHAREPQREPRVVCHDGVRSGNGRNRIGGVRPIHPRQIVQRDARAPAVRGRHRR